MQPPKTISFRCDRTRRLKDFRGYRKGHSLPQRADSYSQKYLAELAREELQEEMDRVFNALREQYSFKRKDLESSISAEGEAVIRAPLFVYRVSIQLDKNDLSQAIIRRELLGDKLEDLGIGKGAIFPEPFDTLRAEWQQPQDIIQMIDELEEKPIPKTKLRLASDNSYFELTIAGFPGIIRMEPRLLSIGGAQDLMLMKQFLLFLKRFEGK